MAYTIEKNLSAPNLDVYKITCDEVEVYGYEAKVAEKENCVLMISCPHGDLYCSIFKTEVLDAIDAAGVIFRAPHLENILQNKPVAISKKAAEMGVTEEMTGEEVVKLFA